MAIETGSPDEETACFGTRGDGKTIGAFGAMIAHAQQHHELGYPLPTKWLGAADTFQSHVAKTHESLTSPLFRGTWQLRKQGHLAAFRVNDVDLVHLQLFGVEDQAGMDRLRAEAHGLWFEEPAPASVLVQSSGLSETAWGLGITSCRMPSYHHPKIMTLNYPDEDHWTWQRFVVQKAPGTRYVRVPPGELASAEQRAKWTEALKSRPDLMRRLLEGKPGALLLGKQVAIGFNEDTHVRPCQPMKGLPVWIGQDGGESHTWCSVVLQRIGPHINVLASILSEPSGARQHMKHGLIPWLGEHTPWVLDQPSLCYVEYDEACDTEDPGDLDSNPLRTMGALLPGRYRPGPVSWAGRLNPMYSLLNDGDGQGSPRLRVDPSNTGLIKALRGGWYLAVGHDGKIRKDTPHKPNHPHEDYGDAFCYAVAGAAPSTPERDPNRKRGKTKTDFDVFTWNRPKGKSKTEFRV